MAVALIAPPITGSAEGIYHAHGLPERIGKRSTKNQERMLQAEPLALAILSVETRRTPLPFGSL
jgi:hypothetical protein